MGKNDFLAPKQIANRIKAKGLQKLRWYCQMCQKQCRDENGFKCHLTSDGHRRQMEVFGQAPDRVIDGYSEEFHSSFMEHLRMAHPHVRIEAHKVYNEYIQDKHHIHMNSTKWLTLTEYVKYLGREGLCKVEDSPKGWFIQLIQKDADEEEKARQRAARRKGEAEEAARTQRQIEAQIERARAAENGGRDGAGATPGADEAAPRQSLHERDAVSEPVAIALGGRPGNGAEARPAAAPGSRKNAAFQDDADAGMVSGLAQKRKRSQVEELMAATQARKAAAAASTAELTRGTHGDAWLSTDIVVKVVSKAAALRDYEGKKGVVIAIIDGYVAEVEMLDSGDVLRIDQAELQTVIPKTGRDVRIVLGVHAGETAQVREILNESYKVRVRLRSGKEVLQEYEDVCKLSSA